MTESSVVIICAILPEGCGHPSVNRDVNATVAILKQAAQFPWLLAADCADCGHWSPHEATAPVLCSPHRPRCLSRVANRRAGGVADHRQPDSDHGSQQCDD